MLYLSKDANLPLVVSSLYTSLIFGFSVAGKLLFGVAFDRPAHRWWAVGGTAVFALGSALTLQVRTDEEGRLSLEPCASHVQLVVFACVFGLGYGCAFTLVQSAPAKLYGNERDFSHVQSFTAVWQYVGSFTGVTISAWLRDLTGSYTASFALFPLCASLAGLHYLRASRFSVQ